VKRTLYIIGGTTVLLFTVVYTTDLYYEYFHEAGPTVLEPFELGALAMVTWSIAVLLFWGAFVMLRRGLKR